MKILQLFTNKIEGTDLDTFLSCYGISGLGDDHIFSKVDLHKMNTCDKLKDLSDVLHTYYIPCKATIYLQNITCKKAITILRQVLRCHGYKLKSIERNMQNTKNVFYSIVTIDQPNFTCSNSNVQVDFR